MDLLPVPRAPLVICELRQSTVHYPRLITPAITALAPATLVVWFCFANVIGGMARKISGKAPLLGTESTRGSIAPGVVIFAYLETVG